MLLSGGGNSRAGRVELHGSRNGYICDDSWDERDAQVICRMIGLK